jgi:hypothetical protein
MRVATKLTVLATLVVCVIYAMGRQSKSHAPPTAAEKVVIDYERLVMRGALLTETGWSKAAQFFEKPAPYPTHSKIRVVWTPSLVFEVGNRDNRAEVQSKWGNCYGIIDEGFRYLQCPVSEAREYYLVRANGTASGESNLWRLEGPHDIRLAPVDATIEYLQRMQAESPDPSMKKNARRSIELLRLTKRKPLCGTPNPC